MKTASLPGVLLIGTVCFSTFAFAEASKNKDEWQSSILTESTIKKVQEAEVEYKKCIGEQIQKPAYLDIDSRKATEQIIKQCEPALSKMREVYISEKVPGEIADRHLKQLRVQMIRGALENLMFAQATRKANQP